MNNEQLEKQLFEAALRHAVSECVEEECAPIREKYAAGAEPKYSSRFRLRMKRLLHKNKPKGWTVYRKRAAAIAAVVCMGVFATMSVEAVRMGVSNFFYSITNEGTTIDLDGSDSNKPDIPDGWDFVYAPAYLPKGYVIEKTDFFGDTLSVEYISSSKDRIDFMQSQSLEGALSIDSEDAITESILIGTPEGMYVEKNGRSKIFWSGENSWFLLITNLGKEETIKIAQSVKKIEKKL